MPKKELDLVHDAMQERKHVARYLRAIADGLEEGQLRLKSGEHEVELHPPTLCSFELRATTERQRVRVRVQLGWREVERSTNGGELEISSS
jgi:amphi-Trp domain-containing protein